MIHFGKSGQDFIITNTNTATNLILNRDEVKAVCRYLMVELNIVEFYLNDGRAGHLIDKLYIQLLEKRWGLDSDILNKLKK